MSLKKLFRVACLLFLAAVAQAQSRTSEGLVLNSSTDEYIENARVTLVSRDLAAFTDNLGQYRLANVPVGTARVSAFRTGLAVETADVALDYMGGSAMSISLKGVPSGEVPVTMNGFSLARTTASSPTGRDVEIVKFSPNNLARINSKKR